MEILISDKELLDEANIVADFDESDRFEKIERKLLEHDQQFELIIPVQIHTFSRAHDRFLIIDEETVYHIGASSATLNLLKTI